MSNCFSNGSAANSLGAALVCACTRAHPVPPSAGSISQRAGGERYERIVDRVIQTDLVDRGIVTADLSGKCGNAAAVDEIRSDGPRLIDISRDRPWKFLWPSNCR